MQHEKINYLEFPSSDLEASKAFFTEVFGWDFVDYGPEYTAFSGQGVEGGGGFYKANLASVTSDGATLVVFYSDDLHATLAKVEGAGGEIIKPIFEFPGGSRFHFIEPCGNEFAVWKTAEE